MRAKKNNKKSSTDSNVLYDVNQFNEVETVAANLKKQEINADISDNTIKDDGKVATNAGKKTKK